MTQSTTKRAHLLIAGRVQGVGFRYSTAIEAESLGLNGWVRNLPDGRVEVVAEGTQAAVARLIEWCRQGPRYAWVRNVDVAWEAPQDETRGFGVR
ncbi:MAG: acylphosphatase [Gammaproteobacteria bacterium]|nr:acylphosphatase [Gammaproteobacteria bacterium]